MPAAPMPNNEEARLKALVSCAVLDTEKDEAFDALTKLAAELCDVPIAMVSLIDTDRQWFKSVVGIPTSQTPRDQAFCGYTILSDETLVIEDATKDTRTCDNELVLGEPGIRFYAGCPLILDTGEAVGTLCVIDTKPRKADDQMLQHLSMLSNQIVKLLELMRERNLAEVSTHELTALRTVLDHHTLFSIADPSGRIVDVNEGFCAISGYSREELIGQDHRMLNSGYHPKSFWVNMWKTIASGKPWRAEVCNRAKDGSLYWVDSTNVPQFDADGKIARFISLRFDITSRKRAEIDLKEAEEQNRMLVTAVERSPDPMLVTDLDGYIHFANSAAEDLDRRLGHASAAGSLAFIFDESRVGAEVIDRLIETVLSNAVFEERVGLYPFGSTQESIARGESVDKIMWVQLAASPLHDENGKVNRILLIKRDITEQAENEIRLRHAKEVAETANQTKSEFLANMSHEIRTPMTAILGYADLLEVDSDDPADRERSVDAVRTIRNNANHLLTIINDILDMSKIEAGQMRVETIETSPVQIVEEVVSLVRPRANGKRVDACAVFETRMPRIIQSDPTRLRQILLNLMGNAIKFTEVGSVKLCVGFDSQRRRVNFRVVDTGIGMTPKQCEHVSQFAAFNQADTSMSRRYGGTGLGLRISNALSMMLGGEGISIKSTEGVGSTFSVSISVGAIDRIELVDPAQASADQQVAVSNAEADKSKKFEGKPLDGYRILLAEDGPDNQRLISFHLKKAGADVTVADNGRIACEIIESAGDQVPDVVLMDMQMPELDGYSASRRLRDQGFDKPIIALTAHAMQGDRERCLAAGCDDYLTKPIDRSKLVRTCVAWFGNQSDQASAA